MIIEASDLSFSYPSSEPVLKGISFCVREGEIFAIVGGNGSGKSTLARHLNALLPMQSGTLKVAGMDASDPENTYPIRRACGMVFQNPNNEFVSSVAQEDIAFGLQNFNFPESEIPKIVSQSLASVGLSGFEKRDPHSLSGGQKQRLAIAAVLALSPKIIVLDEATAMLDPEGRKQVIDLALSLKSRGITVVMITHFVEEAALADKVMVLSLGRLLALGSPKEVLVQKEILKEARLLPVLPTLSYWSLLDEGLIPPSSPPLTKEGLWEAMCR
ncbi:MAG: ATP-binding cassette domain-containing protein [Aeriscardovia sp.]|nr:ATP-binding cassette domain-containing protein [Aeriscardovia sp.]